MSFDLKSILSNPVVKTVLTNAAGAAAASLDAVIQAGPTGGAASVAASNPTVALAYIVVQQLLHNYLSQVAPPKSVVTK